MPLYGTTEIESKNNNFIGYLYNYRKSLMGAEEIIRIDGSAVQSGEYYKLAMYYYKNAIQHALDKATNKKFRDLSEQMEKNDFHDWLCCNKFQIVGVFNTIASYYKKQGQGREANEIISEQKSCFSIISELDKQSNIPPSLEGKIIDLDRTKYIAEIKHNKNALRTNYAQKFYDLLRTTNNNRDSLTSWFTDTNRQWLETHRKALKTLLDNHGANEEKEEFEREWKSFQDIDQLAKNQEQRNSLLCQNVENSIELYFKWEKRDVLSKAIAEFEEVLKKIREQVEKTIANIPSAAKKLTNFIGTIFGTILWPIIAPSLLLSDKILGRDDLNHYHQFLKTGRQWIMDHPIIALLVAAGLVASIALPFLHAGYIAIGAATTFETFMTIGTIVSTNFATMHIMQHSHDQEIQTIKAQYEQQLNLQKIIHRGEIGQKELSLNQQLTKNKTLREKEEKSGIDNYQEYQEFLEWKQQQNRNQPVENTNNNAISESNNNNAKPTTSIQKEAMEIFNTMNSNDAKSAQSEIEGALDKFNTELTTLNQERANIENRLSEGQRQLNELERSRLALVSSISSTAASSIMVINPNTGQAAYSNADLIRSNSAIFNSSATNNLVNQEQANPTQTNHSMDNNSP